ncbi:hypothetical protein D3C81_1761880 [compost metagenome]
MGMHSATATPASVACTPDCSTKYHSTPPIRRYGNNRLTPNRFIAIRMTRVASEASNIGIERPDV